MKFSDTHGHLWMKYWGKIGIGPGRNQRLNVLGDMEWLIDDILKEEVHNYE